MKEVVPANGTDKDVRAAIVIIVTNRHAHPVTHMSQPGLPGYIDKLQLAGFAQHIAEQAIARFPSGSGWKSRLCRTLSRLQHGTLQQKDIQIPIAVIVKQGHARAHDLRQVKLPGGAREMLESQSSFGGGIAEFCAARPR